MVMNEIKNLLKKYEENNAKCYIEKICEVLNENIIESPFNTFHYWDDVEINGYYTPCIVEQRHGYDYALYPIDNNISQRLVELTERRGGNQMKIFNKLKQVTNKEEQMKIMWAISQWYDYGLSIKPIIPKNHKELTQYIDKCLKDRENDYGDYIDIKGVATNVPCMPLGVHDGTFIGNYYAVINQFEEDCCLNYSIDEEKEMLKETGVGECLYKLNRNEAIKQEIKFIKNVIKEIDKISEETDDHVWDEGPIETTLEVYTTLEKQCQKIIDKLNIDFELMEYGIEPCSVVKAIELIEKEIL